MYRLIGLVGFKGSGKDTFTNKLIKHHPYTTIAFADAIKDCLSAIFCWPRHMLEGDTKESRTWRETVDVWWADRLGIPDFSPRWAMTNFGTDLMRKHFDDRVWILNTDRRIDQFGDAPVIVKDCRFPNEIAALRARGGVIGRVKRGSDPAWYSLALMANKGCSISRSAMQQLDVHESEWAWIGERLDFEINNHGSLDDLDRKVGAFIGA